MTPRTFLLPSLLLLLLILLLISTTPINTATAESTTNTNRFKGSSSSSSSSSSNQKVPKGEEGSVYGSLLNLLPKFAPSSLGPLQEKMGDLTDVGVSLLNALKITDKCEHRCPTGQRPKQNPKMGMGSPDAKSKMASPKGSCGSYGITLNSEFDFDSCCAEHDLCYEECMKSKELCDRVFRDCMERRCKFEHFEDGECVKHAGMFFTGVTAMGCKAFLVAQENACVCYKKLATRKSKRLADLDADEL